MCVTPVLHALVIKRQLMDVARSNVHFVLWKHLYFHDMPLAAEEAFERLLHRTTA
jgi:hypothetical protein